MKRSLLLPSIVSVFFLLLTASVAASSVSAIRDLPATYTAGTRVGVSITITPSADVLDYLVEETVPAGWTVTGSTDSGTYFPASNLIRWGPFFGPSAPVKILTYNLTPPAGTTGLKTFSGNVTYDAGFINITSGDTTIASTVSADSPTTITVTDKELKWQSPTYATCEIDGSCYIDFNFTNIYSASLTFKESDMSAAASILTKASIYNPQVLYGTQVARNRTVYSWVNTTYTCKDKIGTYEADHVIHYYCYAPPIGEEKNETILFDQTYSKYDDKTQEFTYSEPRTDMETYYAIVYTSSADKGQAKSISADEKKSYRLTFKVPIPSSGEFDINLCYMKGLTKECSTLDPWWNATWTYRRTLTLTNGGSTRGSNTTIRLFLNLSALYSASHMQADCDDLRFTNTTNSLLKSYVYNCQTSGPRNTTIYVMLYNLPTGSSDIYMYYGNAGASTGNSLTAADTIDELTSSAPWTSNDAGWVVDTTNHWITTDATAGSDVYRSTAASLINASIEFVAATPSAYHSGADTYFKVTDDKDYDEGTYSIGQENYGGSGGAQYCTVSVFYKQTAYAGDYRQSDYEQLNYYLRNLGVRMDYSVNAVSGWASKFSGNLTATAGAMNLISLTGRAATSSTIMKVYAPIVVRRYDGADPSFLVGSETTNADTTPPVLTWNWTRNTTSNYPHALNITARSNEAVSLCRLEISGANSTMTLKNTTYAWYSYSGVSTVGNHTFKVYCNDTSNNWGHTYTVWYNIIGGTPTFTINSAKNTTITTTSHTFNVTTDYISNCTLHLDGSTYANSTKLLTHTWTRTLTETNHTGIYYTCTNTSTGTSPSYWLRISLCPGSMAGYGTAGDPCQITDCSNDLNTANLFYEIQNNITGIGGTCFIVGADNVSIDGTGHSVNCNGVSSGLEMQSHSNLRLTNITFNNPSNIGLGFDAGYSPVSGIILTDVTIYNTSAFANAIETHTYDNINYCSDVMITRLNITNIQHDTGGASFECANLTIDDSYISTLGIALGIWSENATIRNSVFKNTIADTTNDYGTVNVHDSYGGYTFWGRNITFLNDNITGINPGRYIIYDLRNNKSQENYVIYNNSKGQVKWTLNGDLASHGNLTFPGVITLSQNYAYFDSMLDILENPLNSPANITLYDTPGIGLTHPAILKNGIVCADCHNFTSLTAATVIFNVTSWSNYTIGNSTTTYYNGSLLASAFTLPPVGFTDTAFTASWTATISNVSQFNANITAPLGCSWHSGSNATYSPANGSYSGSVEFICVNPYDYTFTMTLSWTNSSGTYTQNLTDTINIAVEESGGSSGGIAAPSITFRVSPQVIYPEEKAELGESVQLSFDLVNDGNTFTGETYFEPSTVIPDKGWCHIINSLYTTYDYVGLSTTNSILVQCNIPKSTLLETYYENVCVRMKGTTKKSCGLMEIAIAHPQATPTGTSFLGDVEGYWPYIGGFLLLLILIFAVRRKNGKKR